MQSYDVTKPSRASSLDLVPPTDNEDLFTYVLRTAASDPTAVRRLLGAANAFKEGDALIGVAASNDTSRAHARALLANTTIGALTTQPPFTDGLDTFIRASLDARQSGRTRGWTVGQLKAFLLSHGEDDIKAMMRGLHSDAIAAVVKVMSNAELTQVSAKVFNPLPHSNVGARGYLGARLQPNSPTDNPEDIRWQVFNGFAFATGDVLLGTNPVDGRASSVSVIEMTLRDIIDAFHLSDILPWCVLAHVDVQTALMQNPAHDVALVFQSLAGNDVANQTFGISVDKMVAANRTKTGRFGFYYETGQGADFTNGAHHGTDMVVHESRKYGFVRALNGVLAQHTPEVWTIVNDVAGFIGPEVYRNADQLIRCCLEDLVMAKLHGLCMGHDVCATLHMDVTLSDLDRCLEALMPANPAYLMALPTRNDPMLSYLSTAFQDHVRLRERFGYRINDDMARFFHRIGILNAAGSFTEHAGDPFWVYYQYRLARGDSRDRGTIVREGEHLARGVVARGVPLAIGHGEHVGDMDNALRAEVEALYADAKRCLGIDWDPDFLAKLPNTVILDTTADSRDQFVARPTMGEVLPVTATHRLETLRASRDAMVDVQIVVSDGLNAAALMDEAHLAPLLDALPRHFAARGMNVAPELIVLRRGRVRAGYAVGRSLFADPNDTRLRVLVHVIGERPGTPHHNYSVYVAALSGSDWNAGLCDHDRVRVVSGISDTALLPHEAARLVTELVG